MEVCLSRTGCFIRHWPPNCVVAKSSSPGSSGVVASGADNYRLSARALDSLTRLAIVAEEDIHMLAKESGTFQGVLVIGSVVDGVVRMSRVI
jgi:hypothetical protein